MAPLLTVVAPLDLWIGPGNPFGAGQNGAAPTANVAYLAAFSVNRSHTVTKARYIVQAQSGNVDIGIYNADGTRLGSTGSTAVGAVGSSGQVINLTAAVTLVPGLLYWAALAADNTTVRWVAHYINSSSLIALAAMGLTQQVATSFPLPAPLVLSATAPSAALLIPLLVFEA
jgi:hypothetical protein